jgi:RNA recognition motif-containing protein
MFKQRSRRIKLTGFLEKPDVQTLFKSFDFFGDVKEINIQKKSRVWKAYVTMVNHSDVKVALEGFHHKKLIATLAPAYVSQLFVGGIDPKVTVPLLTKFFNCHADVIDCAVMQDRMTGKSKGFGFVTLIDSKAQTEMLLKKRYMKFRGRQIEVKKAVQDPHGVSNTNSNSPGAESGSQSSYRRSGSPSLSNFEQFGLSHMTKSLSDGEQNWQESQNGLTKIQELHGLFNKIKITANKKEN